MTVYVVSTGYPYEGEEVGGAFTEYLDALSLGIRLSDGVGSSGTVYIRPFEGGERTSWFATYSDGEWSKWTEPEDKGRRWTRGPLELPQ